jgi:hypothetical protein
MTGKFVKGAWVEDDVQRKLGEFLFSSDIDFDPVECGNFSSIEYTLDFDRGEFLEANDVITTSTRDVDNYRDKLENLSDKYGSSDKPIGCKENEKIAGNYTLFEMLQMKLFGKIFT